MTNSVNSKRTQQAEYFKIQNLWLALMIETAVYTQNRYSILI